MKKERMSEQQAETKRNRGGQKERKIPEKNEEVFIASGIKEQSDAMARWSLSPTPIPFYGKTMPELAESLSSIDIVDPNIEKRVREISKKNREITKDDNAFLASVALAKAKVVENEGGLEPRTKKDLTKFKETILSGVGKIIGRTGGEKALRTTAAISLTLTACSSTIAPKMPEVAQNIEPVATEVVEEPTPFESQKAYSGSPEYDSVLAVPGIPEGFGGIGSIEKTTNSQEIQEALNRQGYAPLVDSESVLSSIQNLDGIGICIVPLPEKLYNPQVATGEDIKMGNEKGLVLFGNNEEANIKVLSSISFSRYPEGFTCVSAIVVDDANPAGVGVLRLLLIDEKGEIQGEMPAVFSAEDDVRYEWDTFGPRILVNEEEQTFALRETTSLISSEGLLSECVKTIEVETDLVGKARVEGEMVDFNFPNIKNSITFGLHPSVVNRAEGSKWGEVKDIYLDTTFGDLPHEEGAAKRQILADTMYLHFRSWQFDSDSEFYEERKDIDFMKYLTMLNDGEIDGSHLQRLRMNSTRLYPEEEQIRIYPLDPMYVIFASYLYRDEPYIGGTMANEDFVFDPTTGKFVVVADVQVLNYAGLNAYAEIAYALSKMSYPKKFQWGNIGSNSSITVDESKMMEQARGQVYNKIIQNWAAREIPLMGN